ncbi:MAG: hypothetical protein ACYC4D_09165 [Thermoleophilia bacterium]
MSRRRKSRIALIGLPMLLVALLTGVLVSQFASALTGPPGGQWATVAQYVDAYIQSQYSATDDGEAGFIYPIATLKTDLDSNNDGVYLGEGDLATNAPVLVDVANKFGGSWIPGTSAFNSYTASASVANADAVKAAVDKHITAGFSDKIVNYCVTGHTEDPTTMAYGAMSQAGYFGATNPEVYSLKWGRLGWGGATGLPAYPYAATNRSYTSSYATPGTTALPTNATDCSAEVTNAGVVRCAAAQAVSVVGSGTNPWVQASDATTQVVDLRPGTPANTIAEQSASGAYAIQVPINTLFTSTGSFAELQKLDTSKTSIVFANRTQHSAGIAATGARMLGYSASYLRWGLPAWNATTPPNWPEQWTSNPGYAFSTTEDLIAPVISSVVATPTNDGGTITYSTVGDPSTTKLEWSLTAGGPYTAAHDMYLHASHTATITGQAQGVTIYYRLTSYDGMANPSVTTTEASFTTLVDPGVNDKVYYLPWYDSVAANGWIGDWIGVVNMDNVDSATVEIRIGGVMMGTQVIAPGDDWNPTPQNYPGEIGGPVQVICWNCVTNNTVLVVNQRALYAQSFSEILAVEKADLGKEYVFPWYDNMTANGVIGAWVMVTNADSTTATVEVYVGGTLRDTLTIAAGDAAFYRDPTGNLMGGPVRVVTSGGTQKLVVSQRVLYMQSFNEILGQKIS